MRAKEKKDGSSTILVYTLLYLTDTVAANGNDVHKVIWKKQTWLIRSELLDKKEDRKK